MSTNDMEKIEQDLAQTRSRLNDRLDHLQTRLAPNQIFEDTANYLRGSDGAGFVRNLTSSVRENPLPTALSGIGLAWLMAASQTSSTGTPSATAHNEDLRRRRIDLHAKALEAERGVTKQPSESDVAHLARVNEVRGSTLGIKRDDGEAAESYGTRVVRAMNAAKGGMAANAHDLRDYVGDLAESASETTRSAVQSVRETGSQVGGQLADGATAGRRKAGEIGDTLMGSPAFLGALGLAAGAILAAVIPKSDQEEAALGGMAAQVRGAARGLAQDVVDRGGRTVQKISEVGQSSAREHGLAGSRSIGAVVDDALDGKLAKDVEEVAKDTLKAGDRAVRQ